MFFISYPKLRLIRLKDFNDAEEKLKSEAAAQHEEFQKNALRLEQELRATIAAESAEKHLLQNALVDIKEMLATLTERLGSLPSRPFELLT